MLTNMQIPRILSIVLLTCLTTSIHGADVEYINNGRGPVPLYLPSDYDGSTSLPLIVALHGYTDNGSGVESYFNLSNQVDSKQFLYCDTICSMSVPLATIIIDTPLESCLANALKHSATLLGRLRVGITMASCHRPLFDSLFKFQIHFNIVSLRRE